MEPLLAFLDANFEVLAGNLSEVSSEWPASQVMNGQDVFDYVLAHIWSAIMSTTTRILDPRIVVCRLSAGPLLSCASTPTSTPARCCPSQARPCSAMRFLPCATSSWPTDKA